MVQRVDIPEPIDGIDFSPTANLLALGGRDGIVLLWDTAAGVSKGKLTGVHRDAITAISFSDDGRKLVVGDEPSMQRNQRGALTQFDGGEPITVRAARHVGDILNYVPDDQAIAPRYSFYM